MKISFFLDVEFNCGYLYMEPIIIRCTSRFHHVNACQTSNDSFAIFKPLSYLAFQIQFFSWPRGSEAEMKCRQQLQNTSDSLSALAWFRKQT